MNEAKITLNSLMDDAAAYFLNLKNTGNWKTEITRNTQIIALTIQISALESKVSKLSTDRTSSEQSATPSGGTGASAFNSDKYIFELWGLKKVDNKAEQNMIEPDGKTWYWWNNHTYNNKGVAFISLAVSMMHGEPRRINSKREVSKILW
jgi:hypothetical protein